MGDLINGVPAQERGEKGKFANKLPEGVTRKQSHYSQQLAKHKHVIEEVIAEAAERIITS